MPQGIQNGKLMRLDGIHHLFVSIRVYERILSPAEAQGKCRSPGL